MYHPLVLHYINSEEPLPHLSTFLGTISNLYPTSPTLLTSRRRKGLDQLEAMLVSRQVSYLRNLELRSDERRNGGPQLTELESHMFHLCNSDRLMLSEIMKVCGMSPTVGDLIRLDSGVGLMLELRKRSLRRTFYIGDYRG